MNLKIKDTLKSNNIRPSLYKIKIYEYLQTHRIHPDAEKIYNDLLKKLPTISRATVYNILKEFLEKHIIIAIPVEHSLHYDAYLGHSHFLCEKCNSIYDLNITEQHFEQQEIDGHIVNFKCELYKGLCKNCRNKLNSNLVR